MMHYTNNNSNSSSSSSSSSDDNSSQNYYSSSNTTRRCLKRARNRTRSRRCHSACQQQQEQQQHLPCHFSSFKLPLLLLLLHTCLATHAHALAVGVDTSNANLTDLGSPAPKYQTAYACEGKKLTIECDPGDLINLIRANYGRFSITICNDHGNVEWSVNCMFPKSLTVLNSKCAHKQSCSVLATTSMFGDPCPGTHKYLEAHYQCISAAQTSTTTNRPSPPWVLTNTPPLLANGSTIINPAAPPQAQAPVPPRSSSGGGGIATVPGTAGIWHMLPSTPASTPTMHTTLPGGRLKGAGFNATTLKNANRHDGLPPPPPLHHHHHASNHHSTEGGVHMPNDHASANSSNGKPTASATAASSNTTTPPNTRILTGVGGAGSDDGTLLTARTTQNRGSSQQQPPTSSSSSADAASVPQQPPTGSSSDTGIRTINNINNLNVVADDETNMFCGPTNARHLFWNFTRVGDVNVQPCPGGATGIAKWRCVQIKRMPVDDDELSAADTATTTRPHVCHNGSSNCETPTMLANKVNQRIRNFEPTWHPLTPDLTQCRSLWLNNLEVRVNQPDSSLTSIANDLSEVTSSKTLYGGDMLVTTKIIQTMSEKMFHDKETYPDQRQREAIILELLHGVVKTGSNLLDESQLSSWLDLNQEDQMRVATSLLTGLEYNAFLLADTIIRERNVVQKVKNILLSVRVLEKKNIQAYEVFPDAEQWQISDDRIELPRAALVENSEGGLVRIVFAAFDRLESILKPSYDHFDLKSARSYVRNTAILANDSDATNNNAALQQRIRILNSKVISASLGKGRHIQLSQPIKLVLRHLKTENVTNPTCVFWNYIDHAWSANGCSLESTNRTHSICMCNHLTNFAILMDVMDEHNHSLFGMFDGNMRVLIYISIAICLVFIVIALLTLKIFNGVFIKSARTSIYRNIYLLLLFIEILFLCGIEQMETSKVCGFITLFIHCSILAAIAWFCFEAFQSYSTLTTDDMLLEVDQTFKVNCYYLLSYGLSLTIVAISLVINPSTYTKSDYCVLMEANTLFYASFVTPVFIFFLGALCYTSLSCLLLCRKSRTTLKNKEHTRLANVRFDIRCSFIFLLLLSAVWISAYYYLRYAKIDDEAAGVFGYFFISFNTLMGLYIFVFHCIQNEKIRREYRKYVRQNSWLPKCLRCSKTSISSGIVVATAGGTISSSNAIGAVGTGTQLKKSKLPVGDTNENDETGGIISAAEDAIMASSDCELNEASSQIRRTPLAGTIKSGIMPGSMVLQHGKANSIIDSMQGHIVLERAGASGSVMPGTSATLRSTGAAAGTHTPSAGHTSPTSSAGSTHLIFQHAHKQQPAAAGNGSASVQEAYYHHPDYYSWKQQTMSGVKGAPAYGAQQKEISLTQKHGKKKQRAGSGAFATDASPSGSLHSRGTGASQQTLYYASYKKNMPNNQQQQYPQYAEALEPYYQQQQQHRRHPSALANNAHLAHLQQQQYLQQQQQHHQQQQQLSSDDEQMESAANRHLLHLSYTPEFGHAQMPLPSGPMRYFKNKHSNCDLSRADYEAARAHGVNESYYNQGSLSGGDGPVYEEILSNRNSDVQHYDISDENAIYGDDDDDESVCDGDVDDEEDEEHARDAHFNGSTAIANDERMRRLMALQDADFQRRFQRQQRKNGALDANVTATGYRDYDAQLQQQHFQQQQQQQPTNAVFGISGGGGSGRSFKKMSTLSPSGRLAVNELFNHGPPLPPANQHPMHVRQQQHQQQLSPQSNTSATSSSQQPIRRNISAMLDENNMVRCYLEPK